MAIYRVIYHRDRCIDCGISIGHCPIHAKVLSRLLNQNKKEEFWGTFTEEIYERIKHLVDACPAQALIIEKIDS